MLRRTPYGFAEMVRRRRKQHCRAALIASATPPNITALAYELGFNSSESFYRAFRKQFATTPRQVWADGQRRLMDERGVGDERTRLCFKKRNAYTNGPKR